MLPLLFAACCLVLSHVVVSAPGVRPALIARLGRPAFLALHSLVSLVALSWVVWAWRGAEPNFLYAPRPWGRELAVGLMPLALFLIVGRLTTPYGEPEAPLAPQGIYRICRYPGSAGLILWALLHLPNLGDARQVTVFGAALAMTVAAVVKNEILRGRAPQSWRHESSVIPFVAILAQRQHLNAREIGWRRLGLGILLYAALLMLHPLVLGVDPLAGFASLSFVP